MAKVFIDLTDDDPPIAKAEPKTISDGPSYRLRVSWGTGSQVLTLREPLKWEHFTEEMKRISGIPVPNLVLHSGYPPKRLEKISDLQTSDVVRLTEILPTSDESIILPLNSTKSETKLPKVQSVRPHAPPVPPAVNLRKPGAVFTETDLVSLVANPESARRQLRDYEEDYQLALLLSLQEPEAEPSVQPPVLPSDLLLDQPSFKHLGGIGPADVHNEDLFDPTPDLHALFLQFNDQYFHGHLAPVEVKWSRQMTLCAGICEYRRGGICIIKLSEPLLKYRPRSDFINTLLHEMIHAYLFLTKSSRDRDGHGPDFLQLADEINRRAATHITVYHNFVDEVEHYRQHHWLCDGPCVKKPPYFGSVKRATNRPPGPNDPWFRRHQESCGGTFKKIKEPDGYGQKKRTKTEGKPGKRIKLGDHAADSALERWLKPKTEK